MKKILVVDDNKNNRLTLQFILEDWEEEHPDNVLAISFAENGKEAVEKCETEMFDMILMDIMMPVMDGIEATALIRQGQNKGTMIIACSALSDNEHKNRIITAGAEDYILKPIDSELFSKRFTNYMGLIKNRHAQPYNVDAENVIDNEVYYRKVQFIIKNEVALSEFWEYFLLESCYADSEEFSDMIRLLYGLGSYQIKKNYNFNIFMEENDEKLYITMDNVVLLKAGLIESIIKKNYSNADYKILGNKVTFSIAKLDHSNTTVLPAYEKEEEETSTADVILNSEIQEVPAEVSKPMTASLVEVAKESEVEIQIFDFMDPEDLCEIEEITSEMRSLIMLVGNANLADEDIELLAFHIQKFGIVSSVYSETYAISSAMKQLSEDILANKERFLERASDIGVLCDAFSKDLLLWIQKLFYDGAPSIDFLDNSIISNANMITSFIKEEEVVQEEEALDDIFDF